MSLKVGFIGVGRIAQIHMDILAKMKDVDLIAFCDIEKEKAREYAQKFGGKAYSDHYQMFKKENLDALYVCVPPFAHTDQEIIAAERKINLFIEKPVALALGKAREVEKAILKNTIICSVGYVVRYLDLVEKIKRLIKDKKITLALGRFHDFPYSPSWWKIKKKSGGQLVEQATHVVDIFRYLLGEPDRVYAQSFQALNKREEYDIDDASAVNLHFKNGTLGVVSSSCIGTGRGKEGIGVELLTSGMELHLLGWSVLKIYSSSHLEEWKTTCNMYELEDKAFIKAIRNNDSSPIRSSYSDAIRTLQITLLAGTSTKTGKVYNIADCN